MTRPAGHDEARDALAALALDALDDAERAAVLAHVGECDACAAELASLRDTAASLAWAAPREAVDAVRCAGIRQRLITRARAEGPGAQDAARGTRD
jgi:anti-sigma factor RsiW